MISHVREQRRGLFGIIFRSGLFVILFLVLFGSSVYFFRVAQKNDLLKKAEEEITENNIQTPLPPVEDVSANMLDLKTGATAGIAFRASVLNVFTHTIKTQLPTIDPSGSFYEGWLVRLVPYSFFSTGEMITNKEGQYVLEWKGDSETDYSGYTKIVVTLEARDGNPDPSEHVLEGVFGVEE